MLDQNRVRYIGKSLYPTKAPLARDLMVKMIILT